jgi:hypothetical protein
MRGVKCVDNPSNRWRDTDDEGILSPYKVPSLLSDQENCTQFLAHAREFLEKNYRINMVFSVCDEIYTDEISRHFLAWKLK